MSRRKSLSGAGVANLKPRAARYAEPDPELRGHYIRVQPSGAKSYVVVARDPGGKQVWATIGATDLLGIDEARETARQAIKRIRDGLPRCAKRANAASRPPRNASASSPAASPRRTAPTISQAPETLQRDPTML